MKILDAIVDPKAAAQDGAPQVHDDVQTIPSLTGNSGIRMKQMLRLKMHTILLNFPTITKNWFPMQLSHGLHWRTLTVMMINTPYTQLHRIHTWHRLVLPFVLSIPEHKLRVIAPDVGGGFGSKIFVYNDECGVLWASKQIGRPVKWTADRTEAFFTDCHGRDHVTDAKLALDADGNITGLRTKTYAISRSIFVQFLNVYPDLPPWDFDAGIIYYTCRPCGCDCSGNQYCPSGCCSRSRSSGNNIWSSSDL